MPLQFHCIIFFCFFRFHYDLTHDSVSCVLECFCFMGFVCGNFGPFPNSIFSSILYLLLDSGVSFKFLFLVHVWIGLGDDCLCWVLSLYSGMVSIQQGCFLWDFYDLDFGGTLVFWGSFSSWESCGSICCMDGFWGEVCLDCCVVVYSFFMKVRSSFEFISISFLIRRLHFWNSGVKGVCIDCATLE